MEPVLSSPGERCIIAYNTRVGSILFLVYLVLYAAFIYLSAFKPDLMAAESVGGVNLAVIYGFGLIAAAFLLAILYMALCRKSERTA